MMAQIHMAAMCLLEPESMRCWRRSEQRAAAEYNARRAEEAATAATAQREAREAAEARAERLETALQAAENSLTAISVEAQRERAREGPSPPPVFSYSSLRPHQMTD